MQRRSTKPFRRAVDLVFASIFLFCVHIYTNTARLVASWTHSEFYIDKLQNPTLYRAYYINRSRPAELRQKEFEQRERSYEWHRNNREVEFGRQKTAIVMKKQEPHEKLMQEWMWDFEEDVRARQAEEARLAAIEKKRQMEEDSKKELERQAVYAANRQKEIEAERASQLDELKRRELNYYGLNPGTREDYSSPVRVVGVHAVTIRSLPSTKVKALAQRTTGAVMTVDGWINSEVHYGNGIWFRIVKSTEYPKGGWIWGGALINQSTRDLKNLNEDGEEYTVKSADGMIVQTYTTPSPMESRIAQEIRELEAAKAPQYGITASHINATMISAGKLSVGGYEKSLELSNRGISGYSRGGVTMELTPPRSITNEELGQMMTDLLTEQTRNKKLKRERDEAKEQLKKTRRDAEQQQAINQMNSTVNLAISQMNQSIAMSND
jgi:hypothetical protein